MAGTKSAERITFHIFSTGKLVSSTIVGVISNPINLRENTAIAMKIPLKPIGNIPPLAVRFSADQCPEKKSEALTRRDIIIIAKKKMLASEPVNEMLKFERIYQITTMAIAM